MLFFKFILTAICWKNKQTSVRQVLQVGILECIFIHITVHNSTFVWYVRVINSSINIYIYDGIEILYLQKLIFLILLDLLSSQKKKEEKKKEYYSEWKILIIKGQSELISFNTKERCNEFSDKSAETLRRKVLLERIKTFVHSCSSFHSFFASRTALQSNNPASELTLCAFR